MKENKRSEPQTKEQTAQLASNSLWSRLYEATVVQEAIDNLTRYHDGCDEDRVNYQVEVLGRVVEEKILSAMVEADLLRTYFNASKATKGKTVKVAAKAEAVSQQAAHTSVITRPRRKMSAAARKRISQGRKRYWRERRSQERSKLAVIRSRKAA